MIRDSKDALAFLIVVMIYTVFFFGVLSVFGQTVATPSIQEQISALEAEKAQLLALQRDCAAGPRGQAQAAIQAVINKLSALKTEPESSPDIDLILDSIIARLQDRLKDFDAVTPERPCTKEKTAAARIGQINSQLTKLRSLENK